MAVPPAWARGTPPWPCARALASFTAAPIGALGIERAPFPWIQLLNDWIEPGKQPFAIHEVLLQRIRDDLRFGGVAPGRHLLAGQDFELRRDRQIRYRLLPSTRSHR
jgi:hypothetical protein